MRLWGVFFIFFLFLFPITAIKAATLYLSPNSAELNRGDTLKLSMRLDVDEDECVNAIDGTVSYTDNIEPVDISRGNSIMSIWVEEPKIDRQNRTITFAGGIPNGYCGRIVGDPRLTNNIVDILFQSPGLVIGGNQGTSSVEAKVEIADATQVFLNDGYGSLAPLQRFGATVALGPEAGGVLKNEWGAIVEADTRPPEPFGISLDRSTNAFSNRYFITFNTTDKQSGLDHYEVMEEPLSDSTLFRWGRADAPWLETRSPYVLKDQSLNSTIRVRALDKAGNEYIATLVPDESQRTISNQQLITQLAVGVSGLVLVLLLVAGWFFYRRRRSTRLEATSAAVTTENQVDVAVVTAVADSVTAIKAKPKKPRSSKKDDNDSKWYVDYSIQTIGTYTY